MSCMVTVIGQEHPDERIRREWGELLAAHMETLGVSRKELQQRLAAVGVDVTHQAISQWLRGESSPRPHVQAAIAHVLRVPPRSLWPLHFGPAA